MSKWDQPCDLSGACFDLVSCGRPQGDRVTCPTNASSCADRRSDDRSCLFAWSCSIDGFDSMGIQRLDVARFEERPSSSPLRAPWTRHQMTVEQCKRHSTCLTSILGFPPLTRSDTDHLFAVRKGPVGPRLLVSKWELASQQSAVRSHDEERSR
jgi:hypothetical protein